MKAFFFVKLLKFDVWSVWFLILAFERFYSFFECQIDVFSSMLKHKNKMFDWFAPALIAFYCVEVKS